MNDELKKGALISDTLFRAERTIAGTEPHPLFMESLDPDKLKEWNRLAGTGFQDVEQQQEILLSLVSSDLSKMDCFDQFQMELAAYSFIVLSPKQLVDHAKLLFGKEVKQDSAIVKLRYERDQGRFDQTEISRKIRRAMLDEVFGNLKDFQKKKFAVRLGMDPLKINQIFDSPFVIPTHHLRAKSRTKMYGGLAEELTKDELERRLRKERIRYHINEPNPSDDQLKRIAIIFSGGPDYSTPFLNDYWCDQFSPAGFQDVEFLDFQKEELGKYRIEWKKKRNAAKSVSELIRINNEFTMGLSDILLPNQTSEYFPRFVSKTGLIAFLTRDNVAREYELTHDQRDKLIAAGEKALKDYRVKLLEWIRKIHVQRVDEVFDAMNLNCKDVTGYEPKELAKASSRCPSSAVEKRGKFTDKKTYVWSYWWERRKVRFSELK